MLIKYIIGFFFSGSIPVDNKLLFFIAYTIQEFNHLSGSLLDRQLLACLHSNPWGSYTWSTLDLPLITFGCIHSILILTVKANNADLKNVPCLYHSLHTEQFWHIRTRFFPDENNLNRFTANRKLWTVCIADIFGCKKNSQSIYSVGAESLALAALLS